MISGEDHEVQRCGSGEMRGVIGSKKIQIGNGHELCTASSEPGDDTRVDTFIHVQAERHRFLYMAVVLAGIRLGNRARRA